jgi:hypothetical protein
MNLPSLSVHLLNRIYACSELPWRIILAEGDRTERAARHLVALDLVRVEESRLHRISPYRVLAVTTAGRRELARRRLW